MMIIISVTTTTSTSRGIFVISQFQLRLSTTGAGADSGNISAANRRIKTAATASWRQSKNLTARRTRRVRSKPSIDAIHMKSMATLRKNTDLVFFDEFS